MATEMSVPVDTETTESLPINCNNIDQKPLSQQQPPIVLQSPPPPPPVFNEDKVIVSVEVLLKPTSTVPTDHVHAAILRMLENRSMSYVDGLIPVPSDDSFLFDNVQRICICDTDVWVEKPDDILPWQVKPDVHAFQLSGKGPLSSYSQLAGFKEWILPAKEFDRMWESLFFESGLKKRLLRYVESVLHYTEKEIIHFLASCKCNILLRGPPGTGKTSLCKALAQKLSIRFNSRYSKSHLIEINAHSLCSKLFSESGKLDTLVEKIKSKIREESTLVFVLIDKVEILAAARKASKAAASSGSEPSDSIEVVNSLMDELQLSSNVIVLLTTSNISAATDIGFLNNMEECVVDLPTLPDRYEILRSCLAELWLKGILFSSEDGESLPSFIDLNEQLKKDSESRSTSETALTLATLVSKAAEACQGLNGELIRRIPRLTSRDLLISPGRGCEPSMFLEKMIETAKTEKEKMTNHLLQQHRVALF